MAISTLTATTAAAGVQPKVGVLYPLRVDGRYIGSGNTVSDIILLAKLPNRAVVHEVEGFIVGDAADAVVKVGLSGGGSASETAFGTHTFSSTAGTGYFSSKQDAIHDVVVSFTDGAEPKVARVYATLSSGTFTTSWTLAFTVHYSTPNDF